MRMGKAMTSRESQEARHMAAARKARREAEAIEAAALSGPDSKKPRGL